MKKLLLTGTIVLLTAVSASAGPEREHRGHWASCMRSILYMAVYLHHVGCYDSIASSFDSSNVTVLPSELDLNQSCSINSAIVVRGIEEVKAL